MKLIFLLVAFSFCVSALAIEDQWQKHDLDTLDKALHEVEFVVALPQYRTGISKLENFILNHQSNIDSKLYGHYLSYLEICDIIQHPKHDEHVNQVLNYLHDFHIQCDVTCDSLLCTGSVLMVDDAFKVDIHYYQNLEFDYGLYRSTIDYTVPKHLEKTIVFIDGISNQLIDHPLPKYSERMKPDDTKFGPADQGYVAREVLMRMYNQTSTASSPKVSVGAMEYQGMSGFSNNDLKKSQVANGVPKNPVAKDHILGDNGDPDFESELDTQVMYWAAHDATLWYEDFSSPTGGWMYSWSQNFLSREDYPQVISISWGWNEDQQCTIAKCGSWSTKTYVERSNIEFMKITARGTTILVASGDAGSPGRTNELCESQEGEYGWNHINAVYPGSSPWVLSVGATYVVAERNTPNYNYTTPICTSMGMKCATGTTEESTSFDVTSWTSGSGASRWTYTPEWQYEYVQAYLAKNITFPDKKYFNQTGRFYPDVSAFGHNCIVYDKYSGWQGIDGTSCASPIFAGVITQMNSFQLKRGRPLLGFVNPLLYKMYGEFSNTFNDIRVGNSSCTESTCCNHQFGFQATEGWDTVSGLGTPNVGMILEYLKKRT